MSVVVPHQGPPIRRNHAVSNGPRDHAPVAAIRAQHVAPPAERTEVAECIRAVPAATDVIHVPGLDRQFRIAAGTGPAITLQHAEPGLRPDLTRLALDAHPCRPYRHPEWRTLSR